MPADEQGLAGKNGAEWERRDAHARNNCGRHKYRHKQQLRRDFAAREHQSRGESAARRWPEPEDARLASLELTRASLCRPRSFDCRAQQFAFVVSPPSFALLHKTRLESVLQTPRTVPVGECRERRAGPSPVNHSPCQLVLRIASCQSPGSALPHTHKLTATASTCIVEVEACATIIMDDGEER